MSAHVFDLHPSKREPFNRQHVDTVPSASGVYVIYDLAGPIYAGRSRSDIRRRLRSHLDGSGNRNIALAKRIGALQSLSFTFCCLPSSAQADVERVLIASLGVAKFASLRHEGLYEEDL
jgi:hypothetical protein